MRNGKNLFKVFRYTCLLTVIALGLFAIIGTGTGSGGGGTIYYGDSDGDGYGNPDDMLQSSEYSPPDGYASNSTDCNDNDANINPGAAEVCGDGIDNNCNMNIDEGCTCTDEDEDGYYVENYCGTDVDCDDAARFVNPGTVEYCMDDIDNDCDGQTDEDCPTCTDEDEDGYFAEENCGTAVDCDDEEATTYPLAEELCGDAVDNDCDEGIDEGCGYYYYDGDGDGYGNIRIKVIANTAPPNYVNNYTDCDDTNAEIHPGAEELCDNKDNNCTGVIDEGCWVFYYDADKDGFGDINLFAYAQTAPHGYTRNCCDCNDADPAIHPGAMEVCDQIDNNCNDLVDEFCWLGDISN